MTMVCEDKAVDTSEVSSKTKIAELSKTLEILDNEPVQTAETVKGKSNGVRPIFLLLAAAIVYKLYTAESIEIDRILDALMLTLTIAGLLMGSDTALETLHRIVNRSKR